MTTLICISKPTVSEKKRGAEVVFVREDKDNTYRVLGCKCCESWEQWGAPVSVLGDNVDDIEQWRHPNG